MALFQDNTSNFKLQASSLATAPLFWRTFPWDQLIAMPTPRHCLQLTLEHESPPHNFHILIIRRSWEQKLGRQSLSFLCSLAVDLFSLFFTPFNNSTFPPLSNFNLQVLIMTSTSPYLLSLRVYSRTPDSVVGRMSALSSALTRTVAIILLAGLLPGVKADCWIDSYVSC